MTFDVAAGRVTGFVGPNGAGKSTTMRMMVGLARPDHGEVCYDGINDTDLRHPAGPCSGAAQRHRERLGVRRLTAVAVALGTLLLSRRDTN